MKFLADVNIAQSVIKFLRDHSHKDFIELVKLPKYQTPTIIFRVTDQKPENILKFLKKLLEDTKEETLIKSLTVIEDDNTEFITLTT